VRSLRGRMSVALGFALLAATASPAPASALGDSTTVCTGTVSVSYQPPLTLVPSKDPVAVNVASTTLACEGPMTSSVTVTGTGNDLAGASCTGPVAFLGSGSIGIGSETPTPVAWPVAGTPLAQVWAFADVTPDLPQVEAAGTAAWLLDGAGVTPCAAESVSSVTLTAVLVMAA